MNTKPGSPGPLLAGPDFIAGFRPFDYLLRGVLQRRFIYSFTGVTGAGKTAIALCIALRAKHGQPIGSKKLAVCRVLYLAGENPDDVRMRFMAMSERQTFPGALGEGEIYFRPGVFNIAEGLPVLAAEVREIGGVHLVIVDTSAAFAVHVKDENSNAEIGNYARRLRELTTLPGSPAVLVCCHPVKNATSDNLVPRGGGAFLAEMDGNLSVVKRDTLAEVHWQGKFRGPDFEPMGFLLETVTSPSLVDSDGNEIPTVIARPIADDERKELEKAAYRDEDVLLVTMLERGAASLADLAKHCGWAMSDGSPHKMKVKRVAQRLQTDKFAVLERGKWGLTDKGKTEAKRVQERMGATGSYGVTAEAAE